MGILHFWYQNRIFPSPQRVPAPCCRPPGVQNSMISIKNQLNFEVTFTCHFEPLYSPTWLQLGLQNLSQTGLKTMLKCNIMKSWFLQPLHCEMQVFTSPMGLPKRAKTRSKTTSYNECLFNLRTTASKLRFCSNLAPSWAPQGAPKRPPRPLKNHSWKHLGQS